MARKKISQWQARIYKRRLEELEAKTRNDRSTFGCPQLAYLNLAELSEIRGTLNGATKMGHPLSCRLDGSYLYIHGVR